MSQVRKMRFHCANGLLVLRICALLEAALVAKNAFCWQQCLFLLTFFYIYYKSSMGKLVQQKSHLQKTKSTSEPQNQFVVSIQTSKIYLDVQ